MKDYEVSTTRNIYDSDAEVACIGAMLLQNDFIDPVFSEITHDDFYDTRHRNIANYILEYRTSQLGKPIDLVTFTDYLRGVDKVETCGGLSYISSLIGEVPTTTNTLEYARIIREKSTLRQVIKAGNDIIATAYDEPNVDKVLDISQKKVFDIAQKRYNRILEFFNVLEDTVDNIVERLKNPNETLGVPSGFRDLDQNIVGFQNSNLIVIGGRPSMGKTAFAVNILQNMAIHSSTPFGVGFFSLEMSAEELCMRILSAETGISSDLIKRKLINQNDINKIMSISENLSDKKIFIDDTPSLGLLEISSKAKEMVSKGVDLIIIDYLQLISTEGMSKNWSREQVVSSISRGLKVLAKEIQKPIIALSQLNRSAESRSDHRPLLSDLRESGSIEQDADIVLFLHREAYYDKDNQDIENKAELIVAKNRHGKTEKIDLYFDARFVKFHNLDS